MRRLTRDEILAAKDRTSEYVAVPEWGEDAGVYVCKFSIAARQGFFAPVAGLEGEAHAAAVKQLTEARLLAFSIVDEDGKLQFSEEDIAGLAEKNADIVDRIAMVARKLNGLLSTPAEDPAKN